MEILDSGNRREFDTGAVRDISEGKGRCDLLTLREISEFYRSVEMYTISGIFDEIADFMRNGEVVYLYRALDKFSKMRRWGHETMFLELAKHYENGLKKYPERNWEKGIPLHSFIDSGVRHLLKAYRGDTDELHDRAFVWNMMGAAWTMNNKPELCDIFEKEKNNNE